MSHLVSGCLVLSIAASMWAIGRAAEPGGQRAYEEKCSRCHGPEGRGANGPRLVPFDWSDEQARELIRKPECDMPPISESELSDDDLVQVIAYLKTIK